MAHRPSVLRGFMATAIEVCCLGIPRRILGTRSYISRPGLSQMHFGMPHATSTISIPIPRSPNLLHHQISSGFHTQRVSSNVSAARLHHPFTVNCSKAQRRCFWGGGNQNMLSHLEATANKNPQSPTAQNLFYQALLRANMPAIIVERYQTGQFASNSACEAVYQKALVSLTGPSARFGQVAQGGSLAAGQTSGQGSALNSAQMQAVGQAVAAQRAGAQSAMAYSPAGAGGTGGATGSRASPLYVSIQGSWSELIFKYVKFITIFAFIAYLCSMLATFLIENLSAIRKLSPRNNNEAKAEHQKIRFTDVHGCDEAKEELQELVQFLKSPGNFSTLGGKLPKGVLLVGPPGTGKTLLARAVAGEAGVPFFFMSGSEFDEVYVGVGAKRVRELFTAAKRKSPAIIFIDELDAIGGKRSPRDGAYAKQTLNQLLTELDGFEQTSGVVILAATNFPEALDKALTRPGRFDRNVVVSLPDVRGRMAILKHHMKKIIIGKDVRVDDLAAGTPGFSGADLENIVNQAAVRASKAKATAVVMNDLDWAKDKVMMGAEKRSMIMSDKEKEMTAYHEAGHALICMFNPMTEPLYKVTIMPRGQSLGMTQHLPEVDKYSKTLLEYQSVLDMCLAGKVAEELIYGSGNVTSGCASDLHTATKVAYMMVTRCGMSEELGNVDLASNYDQLSTSTKQVIESEIRRLIEDGRVRATDLLQSKRKELDLLAKALLKYETLNKEEAFKVVRGENLDHERLLPNDGGLKLPDLKPGSAIPGPGIKLPEIPGSGSSDDGSKPPPVGGLTA